MSLAAAEFSQIPMSQNLAATLARASDAAGSSGAGEVSLEHVLLSLCEDPDAEAVLTASRVDVQHLRAETIGYLNSLPRPGSVGGLGVSQALSRILEAAAAAARGGRRRDINGAIVLAAIVGDGRSAAAQILQVHGLTFDEAIRALQAALLPSARDALPVIRPADDVLARARERVQSRSAPGLREILKDAPHTMAPPSPPPQPFQPPPPPPMPQAQTSAAEEMPELPPPVASDAEAAPDRDGDEHAALAEEPSPETDPAPISEAAVEAPMPEVAEAPAQPSERQPHPHDLAADRAPPPFSMPTAAPSAYPPPQPPQDFRFPGAPPPPSAPQSARPPFPFDLQRPAPIATPPPIPPMSKPGPPGYGGGSLSGGGPSAPRGPQPSAAPPYLPPQQRGGPPPSPSFSGDPYGFPPMAPYDPSRPPLPAGPYGNTGSATAPAATNMHMPAPSGVSMQAPRQPPRQQRAKIETGQLSENIPRAMRVGKTERVEVRIGKATAKAITEGLDGGGVAWRHEVTVTQAMSVRLRAPDGGFFIETVSPETQWIESNLGFQSDDFASWRFHITPQDRGWARLQIVVSARTIGNDGMAAETALPDQIVDVKVRTNYKKTFVRWTGWTIAAIAGGALAKFGEGGLSVASTIVEKLLK